jgi:hypothetical protein
MSGIFDPTLKLPHWLKPRDLLAWAAAGAGISVRRFSWH